MEFNINQVREFEQFTYEMKELYKKLATVFKDFGGKLTEVSKDKIPQRIMSPFKENMMLFSSSFAESLNEMSNSFQFNYTQMKEKEVYLYKLRKQIIKEYKDKQNQLKVANEQYKVALKEINKSNKNPKDFSKSTLKDKQISETICFDKQRKILERNMKSIQKTQEMLDEHAAEQAQQIFEEFTEGIEFIANTQKELCKTMYSNFSSLKTYVKEELINKIAPMSKQAKESYENTIVFSFSLTQSRINRVKNNQQSNLRKQKSANYLYEDEEEAEENEFQHSKPYKNKTCSSYVDLDQLSKKPLTSKNKSGQRRGTISSFSSPLNVKANNNTSAKKSQQQNNSQLIRKSAKDSQLSVNKNMEQFSQMKNSATANYDNYKRSQSPYVPQSNRSNPNDDHFIGLLNNQVVPSLQHQLNYQEAQTPYYKMSSNPNYREQQNQSYYSINTHQQRLFQSQSSQQNTPIRRKQNSDTNNNTQVVYERGQEYLPEIVNNKYLRTPENPTKNLYEHKLNQQFQLEQRSVLKDQEKSRQFSTSQYENKQYSNNNPNLSQKKSIHNSQRSQNAAIRIAREQQHYAEEQDFAHSNHQLQNYVTNYNYVREEDM